MNNNQMIILIALLLFYTLAIDGIHFNGGSIRWEPVDPYDNSSTTEITIIQSYSWTYPNIDCNTDVPITTSGRIDQNANLTCISDCSTDGGYHINPVNILTDCVSISVALNMMTSQRAVNITLDAGAHFYVSYMGSAWVALDDPAVGGLQWSITSFIDLRMRDDGFINTPPVASVVSPQYAIVNRTMHITIPVSDVNVGDDVRCRWSMYTPGVNRRKRSNEKIVNIRKRRGWGWGVTASLCANCQTVCWYRCPCTCSACLGTTCTSSQCAVVSCPQTTTVFGATTPTTTVETPGTLASTISYGKQQPIDECGGICCPSRVPNDTTLSNCTLTFIGLKSGTWYAVAIQVEDFINETSVIPMSSVPVQFLIYVKPEPTCSAAPVIVPFSGCMEVTVGVSMSFNISVINNCDPTVSYLADLIVTNDLSGIQTDVLTDLPTNASVSYMTFTWTPQANQIGSQELCLVAYTDEQVSSVQYCITFIVTTSSALCITTTTTTSTSTTTATISTSTTSTTVTTATTMVTKRSKNSVNWLLVLGLSLLAFLLAICCCCWCCYYWWQWNLATRRRRRRQNLDEESRRRTCLSSNIHRILGNENDCNYRVLYTRDSRGSIQPPPPIDEVQKPKENNLVPRPSFTKTNCVSIARVNNAEKPVEVGNKGIQPPTGRHFSTTIRRVNNVSKLQREEINPKTVFSTPLFRTDRVSITRLPRNKAFDAK